MGLSRRMRLDGFGVSQVADEFNRLIDESILLTVGTSRGIFPNSIVRNFYYSQNRRTDDSMEFTVSSHRWSLALRWRRRNLMRRASLALRTPTCWWQRNTLSSLGRFGHSRGTTDNRQPRSRPTSISVGRGVVVCKRLCGR